MLSWLLLGSAKREEREGEFLVCLTDGSQTGRLTFSNIGDRCKFWT
jgi:hypothetical protein